MHGNKWHYLAVANFLLLTLFIFYFLGTKSDDRNIAVIDKGQLFSGFKMTQEISNQINITNNRLKAEFDSLNTQNQGQVPDFQRNTGIIALRKPQKYGSE
jgi:hypothetical protein